MSTRNRLSACCRTDIGKRRLRNEDVCSISLEHQYFLVADGIGGTSAGDVASRLFQKTVTEILRKTLPNNPEQAKSIIQRCFTCANEKIQAHATTHHACKGMGCTAELLLIIGSSFVLGHVGDSRTYRLTPDNTIELLTRDHTFVQEQVDRGVFSRREAEQSTLKNILVRAVGTHPQLEVEMYGGEITPATLFLLCTDGLHGMVAPQQIETVLRYEAPLELKAEILINMANDAGGKDNISVSLVEFSR